MHAIHRALIGISFYGLCNLSQAGSVGHPADFTGFSAGLGAGFSIFTLIKHTDFTMISSSPPELTSYRIETIKSNLAPIANISYYGNLKNNWLWGIKGVYKYIGVQQFDLSWSGIFENGAVQSAAAYPKITNEFFLNADLGYQIGNWLLYAGVGPSVSTVQSHLKGSTLDAYSIQPVDYYLIYNKNLWGGAGQLGFQYLLPHRFAIDLSYNLSISTPTDMPTKYLQTGTAGTYTTLTQHTQIIEQGLNITINKYFM